MSDDRDTGGYSVNQSYSVARNSPGPAANKTNQTASPEYYAVSQTYSKKRHNIPRAVVSENKQTAAVNVRKASWAKRYGNYPETTLNNVSDDLNYSGQRLLSRIATATTGITESLLSKHEGKDFSDGYSEVSGLKNGYVGLYREKDWFLDFGTKNLSFIATHLELYFDGVANNHFFLALFNPELAGVDTHSENLTETQKAMIVIEALCNPYYAMRELFKVPVTGKKKPFILHRANLAQLYLHGNCISLIMMLARQAFKTVSVSGELAYLLRFVLQNAEISVQRINTRDGRENLDNVRDFLDALPDWLKLGSKIIKKDNSDKIVLDEPRKAEIKVFPGAKTESAADKSGRGYTIAIPWNDEPSFTDNFHIIYKSSVYAYSTVAIEAERNFQPYGRVLTLTPANRDCDNSEYCIKLIQGSLQFTTEFFDICPDDLRHFVNQNAVGGYVYVEMSYNMLRHSIGWAYKRYRLTLDLRNFKRDVLLQWQNTGTNSPFDEELLDSLESYVRIPRKVIIGGYVFRIYDDLNPLKRYVLAVDTSGSGIEETAFVIDDDHQNTAAVFSHPKITGPETIRLVKKLCDMLPQLVVIIERNNNGIDLIEALLEIPEYQKHLFYDYTNSRENPGGPNILDNKPKRRVYGFHTGENSRKSLMDVLNHLVINYPSKIRDRGLVMQIAGLVIKKGSGKVEHSSSTFDDCVIAKCIAGWSYIYRKSILVKIWNHLGVGPGNTSGSEILALNTMASTSRLGMASERNNWQESVPGIMGRFMPRSVSGHEVSAIMNYYRNTPPRSAIQITQQQQLIAENKTQETATLLEIPVPESSSLDDEIIEAELNIERGSVSENVDDHPEPEKQPPETPNKTEPSNIPPEKSNLTSFLETVDGGFPKDQTKPAPSKGFFPFDDFEI